MEDFTYDLVTSNFGLPGPSDFITGALQALVTGYAANQNFDLKWAGDFDIDDDMHSRLDSSWIKYALLEGL